MQNKHIYFWDDNWTPLVESLVQHNKVKLVGEVFIVVHLLHAALKKAVHGVYYAIRLSILNKANENVLVYTFVCLCVLWLICNMYYVYHTWYSIKKKKKVKVKCVRNCSSQIVQHLFQKPLFCVLCRCLNVTLCAVEPSEVQGIRWNPLFFDGPSLSLDPMHVPPMHGFPVPIWPSITHCWAAIISLPLLYAPYGRAERRLVHLQHQRSWRGSELASPYDPAHHFRGTTHLKRMKERSVEGIKTVDHLELWRRQHHRTPFAFELQIDADMNQSLWSAPCFKSTGKDFLF